MSAPEVCDIADGVRDRLEKFRKRKEKTVAAIILKVNKEALLVEIEEEYEDISIDDLREELLAHQPRFIVLSYVYHHDDGRISYPLCFLFFSPQGCKTELQIMYSGSAINVQQTLKLSKYFEFRDLEEFDEDWLKSKLSFFR